MGLFHAEIFSYSNFLPRTFGLLLFLTTAFYSERANHPNISIFFRFLYFLSKYKFEFKMHKNFDLQIQKYKKTS